jgi:hypothetical protein
MHPLAQLDFSKRVAKRAQYEAFDISIRGRDILVRNGSHAHPEKHEYIVTIDDGVPMACSCPADANYDGACKHRVAVAIRRPLCETLQCVKEGRPPIAADGGLEASEPPTDETDSLSEPEEEHEYHATVEPQPKDDCEECLTDFPCWECYRTGRVDIQ